MSNLVGNMRLPYLTWLWRCVMIILVKFRRVYMATTETLEQALQSLIEDTKQYREEAKRHREEYLEEIKQYHQGVNGRFEKIEQVMAELTDWAKQSKQIHKQTQLELAELAKQSQLKLDEQSQRIKLELAELAKQSKQIHKQTQLELAELAKQSQLKLDEQSQRIKLELAELAKQSQLKLDEQSQRIKLELEASAKQIKQTTQQMGELSQRMGTLVEDMVSPDMLRILRQVASIPEEVPGIVNVRVKEFYPGKVLNGHTQMIEVDAIARCGEYVLVNETKTTFKVKHVDAFLKTLGQLRDYFPALVGQQIFGVISSLRIDPSVVTRASRQGLLVLSLGEGMLELQNEPGFKPKLF